MLTNVQPAALIAAATALSLDFEASFVFLPPARTMTSATIRPTTPGAREDVEDLLLALGVVRLRVMALLRRLDLPRRGRCAGLLGHGGPGYQALSSAPAPKNSATAARSAVTGHGGKRLEEGPAVRLRAHPRVEDRDHAAVGMRADQPPEPLPQLEHRRGQRVLAEPVAAERVDSLAARLDERVARRRERQLVDHEQRERLARHVDSLPEGRRGDEHRGDLLAEALEQALARRLALDEHVVGHAARGCRRRPPSITRYELVSTSARPRGDPAERRDLLDDALERRRRRAGRARPRGR